MKTKAMRFSDSCSFVPFVASFFCVSARATPTNGTPRRLIAAITTSTASPSLPEHVNGKKKWRECHTCRCSQRHFLFQTAGPKVVEMTPAHKIVWSYDSATMNGNAGKPCRCTRFSFSGRHTTMARERRPGRIIEVIVKASCSKR